MSRARYEQYDLTPRNRAALAIAMRLLAEVEQADVIGIIAQNQDGAFIHPRPGLERQLMQVLKSADWQTMMRLVEEHAR